MFCKRFTLLTCFLVSFVVALSACTPNASSDSKASSSSGDQISLFDGQSLEGWTKKGGEATYEVEDGTILGTSGPGPNTFLVSDSTFRNFELTAEVKLEDDSLNSGIQVRSTLEERNGSPHLVGPQVEIEASPPAGVASSPAGEAGYIYGEATGQGWISKEHEPLKVFKNDAWNKYRIRALGDSITAWVNGTRVAAIRDTASNQSGHLGLQVHAVPGDARWQVRWRNLRIRELETAHQ
jgi:hypothetical protein